MSGGASGDGRDPHLFLSVYHLVQEGRYLDAGRDIFMWASTTWADAPVHFLVEGVLILFVLILILRKDRGVKTYETDLSPQVVEELCEEWTPVPLVPPQPEAATPEVYLTSGNGALVTLESSDEPLINLSGQGFLGLGETREVKDASRTALARYGVGSCGPRGFYGTFDSHMNLEEQLAEFFGTPEAIVFSSNYATISSVIPAFSKRGDVLICDKGICHSMQTGALLSRSNMFWFRHNDMADLERILRELEERDAKKKVPLYRKFVVVEGLYTNYGDMCPVAQLLRLKEKYCFRIMMDDSIGFGTLGKTGRGTLEHLGIAPSEIEIRTASLTNAIPSMGGFCVGEKEIIYHQRLQAVGYVFSASSPPFLAEAASTALGMINEDVVGRLQANSKKMASHLAGLENLVTLGFPGSPVFHLHLRNTSGSRSGDEALLQGVVDYARAHGLLLTLAKYGDSERYMPPASIRVSLNAQLTQEQVAKAAEVLLDAEQTITQK